jgi:Protein of unknown function (DUF4232)
VALAGAGCAGGPGRADGLTAGPATAAATATAGSRAVTPGRTGSRTTPRSGPRAGTASSTAIAASPAADGSGLADLAAARCGSATLRLTVGRGVALGGSTYRFDLIFTNTGRSPCSLFGYPGVSLVAADGTSYDLPRSARLTPKRIGLEPGGSAHSSLTYRAAADDDDKSFRPATITVTPPDERAVLRTRWSRGAVRDDRGAAHPTTVITACALGPDSPR